MLSCWHDLLFIFCHPFYFFLSSMGWLCGVAIDDNNNNNNNNKWWSTLRSAVVGSSSSLPPLVSEGGGLVSESVGKADLLSNHFDSKQSREAVNLQLTCHPSLSLSPLHAFRSSEVRRLLLDLDPYGGTDPLGMFPLFLKRTADVITPVFV